MNKSKGAVTKPLQIALKMKFGKIAPFISLLIFVMLTSSFGAIFAFFCKVVEGENAEYPRKIAKVNTAEMFDYLQGKSKKVEVQSEVFECFLEEVIKENFISKKLEAGYLEQVPQIKIENDSLTLKYVVKLPLMNMKNLNFFFVQRGENFEMFETRLGNAKMPEFLSKWAWKEVVWNYRYGAVFDMCKKRFDNTNIKIADGKFLFEEK